MTRGTGMSCVERIFTAARRGAPMRAQSMVTALANQGLSGDRYAVASNRRRPDYHLTLIEAENIEAYALEVDPSFTADLPRRNIVTRGIRLNPLNGRRFVVGNVLCEAVELCEPCSLFARRTRRDVLTFFAQRGGLKARILTGGEIRLGDSLAMEDAESMPRIDVSESRSGPVHAAARPPRSRRP